MRMKARDVATLIYHPTATKLCGKRCHGRRNIDDGEKEETESGGGPGESGGSESRVDEGVTGTSSTVDAPVIDVDANAAIKMREDQERPVLVANITIEVRHTLTLSGRVNPNDCACCKVPCMLECAWPHA